MAVIGLYVLVCDGEGGAEIYSAATTREQASIIFKEAKNMVNKSPELKKILTIYSHNISFDAMASIFRPVSSEAGTLDGLNVHLALIDELHAHKNSDVYDVLDSAKGAREQPIIGVGTTAGLDPQCFCKEKYDQYKNILSETAEGDDWTNPDTWIKANPNLGVSVYIADMMSMCKTAIAVISAQNTFKCKRLNMWVNSAEGWIDMDQYIHSPDQVSKEQLAGMKCYIGCDLANRNDLASIAGEFPLGEGYYAVIHHSFIPEEKIYELSKQHNFNYQAMIEAGYMTATPGNIIDYDFIEAKIMEWSRLYDVLEICIDPWSASQMEVRLLNEGFTVVEVRQGSKTLSEPTKDLEGVIHNQKLTHFSDPLLKWAVGNVILIADENDNVRPSKRKSRFKIDPAAALINAHSRAFTHDENYPDYNEQMNNYFEKMKGMMAY